WLKQVIVHLITDGLQSSFEIWIACKDEGAGVRLNPAHCAYNRKSITWLPDVEIGKQNIEFIMVDFFQRFRDGCHRYNRKSVPFENRGQRESNPAFVVHEQNSRRHAQCPP